MNTIRLKRKRSQKSPSEPPIDLERIVWDIEYRARVRDRLNKVGRRAPRSICKAG